MTSLMRGNLLLWQFVVVTQAALWLVSALMESIMCLLLGTWDPVLTLCPYTPGPTHGATLVAIYRYKILAWHVVLATLPTLVVTS